MVVVQNMSRHLYEMPTFGGSSTPSILRKDVETVKSTVSSGIIPARRLSDNC